MSSYAIYTSSGETWISYDTAPNSLLAFRLLEDHRLDFDLFRGSYFTALGGQYAFTEAPNGHLTSVFPIGAAIVTLPIYAAFWLTGRGSELPAINSPAFEPLRQHYERMAAALVAAVSVGVFFLCARKIADPKRAVIATAVYALATSIWSIASQVLCQHGPVNLFVLAMTYALLQATSARAPVNRSRWVIAAGLLAGFLPVIRPTAILFSIAGSIFVWSKFRNRRLGFFAALLIGAAPGLMWNGYFFYSPLGGYAADAHEYALSPHHAFTTLAALLVSPSRGLFVFSPVLAFSIIGAVNAWRVRDHTARLILLLAIACAVLILQYAFYRYWWAGFSYGPRFQTDAVGIAALLLVYAIPRNVLSSARRSAGSALAAIMFILTCLFSVIVQFVGLNSGAAGSEWPAVPISVDHEPDRVWLVADSQIERNIRAAYFRFFAWDRARSPAYDRGLAAHVTALSPSFAQVAKSSSIDATAVVHTDGRSRAYGYDSGVYVGQLRVRVRIINAQKQTVSEQYLFVRGTPGMGESTVAIGTLAMPAQPGRYVLESVPVLVGGGALEQPPTPFQVVVHIV